MNRKDDQVIGAFVFRNECDGCLTSKYENGGDDGPFAECCKGLNDPESPINNGGFIGAYRTIWLEENINQTEKKLVITRHLNNRLFDLCWTNADGSIVFKGMGMLFGDFLVGSYWD